MCLARNCSKLLIKFQNGLIHQAGTDLYTSPMWMHEANCQHNEGYVFHFKQSNSPRSHRGHCAFLKTTPKASLEIYIRNYAQ